MMSLRTVTELLEDAACPTTTAALVDEHGDVCIDHPNGEERLGDVLARTGETEFGDATAAVHAVYGAVGAAAVGRLGYSDRDPTPIGTAGPDSLSF